MSDSIQALEATKLLDALTEAFTTQDAREFLEELHRLGFMVVAIPVPEPIPQPEPAPNPVPSPFNVAPKPQAMEWGPWLAEVTKLYGTAPHEATARVLYQEGNTPKEAFDDLIPF